MILALAEVVPAVKLLQAGNVRALCLANNHMLDYGERVIRAALKLGSEGGYDAVQIAYDEVAERKLTKPELGHLKKNDVKGAYRHLLELRGQSEAVVGENVTVEVFEPGEKIKVSGIAHGKGFAGTIKRHRFHRGPTSHGSHNVRKPGSIGACSIALVSGRNG